MELQKKIQTSKKIFKLQNFKLQKYSNFKKNSIKKLELQIQAEKKFELFSRLKKYSSLIKKNVTEKIQA